MILRLGTLADQPFLDGLMRQGKVGQRIGRMPAQSDPPDTVHIIENQSRPVGVVGIVQSSVFDGRDYELFCVVDDHAAGHGIGTAACLEAIALFRSSQVSVRRLACVDPENEFGLGLANRLGFSTLGYTRPNGDITLALSLG